MLGPCPAGVDFCFEFSSTDHLPQALQRRLLNLTGPLFAKAHVLTYVFSSMVSSVGYVKSATLTHVPDFSGVLELDDALLGD